MIFMWQHTIHFQMLWRDIHVAKLCHEYHVAKFKRRSKLIHNVATWFAFGKLATCLSRHKKLPHAFQRRESTRRYFWLVKWFSPLPRDNHVAGGSFSCSDTLLKKIIYNLNFLNIIMNDNKFVWFLWIRIWRDSISDFFLNNHLF